MTHRQRFAAGFLSFLLAIWPTIGTAENEGLADLDKATDKKMTVRNLNDLSQVIDLLQAALNKGLDGPNSAFAQQLIVETLMERASVLTEGLIKGDMPAVRTPRVRLWTLAVSDLKRIIQLDAKRPRAHFLMGRLQALAGEREQAIEALDAVVGMADPEQRALLAEALTLRGTLQEDAGKRRADLDRALALAPNQAEALRARAGLLHEQGKYDEALADLDRAIERDPNDADAHQSRGSVLAAKKDYTAALESLDRAIGLAPNAASAYARRGQIKLSQNQPTAALADLDKALELSPRASVVLLLRSHVRLLTGNADGALSDVEKAIRIQPGFLPAIRLRAEILASTKSYETAIASLKALADVRPKDSALQMQLGQYYLASKQARQAIAVFGRVLEADQKSADALRLRGDAQLAVGQQSEAIADYEAALQLRPEESGLLNNLAWVLATSPDAELRNGDRALELATKACRITDYKQSHIVSTLAAAYAETGQLKTAVEWSRKAVDLGKGTPHVADLENELESYLNERPWRELQTLDGKPAKDERSNPLPETDGAPSPQTPPLDSVEVTLGADKPSPDHGDP